MVGVVALIARIAATTSGMVDQIACVVVIVAGRGQDAPIVMDTFNCPVLVQYMTPCLGWLCYPEPGRRITVVIASGAAGLRRRITIAIASGAAGLAPPW